MAALGSSVLRVQCPDLSLSEQFSHFNKMMVHLFFCHDGIAALDCVENHLVVFERLDLDPVLRG
jgi:hypothetical protein